jgi:hypothetical protein
MRSPRTALLTLVAALSGCSMDSIPETAVTDCDAQVIPGVAATDVLFVVDDSGSMLGEQEELSENLGHFVNALVTSPVPLDVRIAVTNTSVSGYAGEEMYPAGGPAPAGTPYPAGAFVAMRQDQDGAVTPGAYLWDATAGWGGPRILSSAMGGAALERDFRANVLVGVRGSGKEQPLRAMRLALEKAGSGDVNDGFLRPRARLAVVIITDEDDCSESIAPPFVGSSNTACHLQANKDAAFDPLADYVSFLGGPLAGELRDPIVAVVAGFDENGIPQGCTTMGGTSSYDDPTRLDDFLAALDAAKPGRTFKDSICESFGTSLLAIADRLIPQTMPLMQAPADWRMLAVSIDRANGTSTPCPLAEDGSSEAPAAGAVFTPPQAGAAASLTFQNGCRLGLGDKIDLRIVCAR